MRKYLIVCLGNIGTEYDGTRHNIGFMVADGLAQAHSVTFDSKRYASVAEYRLKGKTVFLVKPSTYMNLSGKAVRYWLTEHKIPLDNLLIVTDDLSLPFSKLRLKGKGSAGGHNGLGHIEEVLGGNKYGRLRMGIGAEFSQGHQVDYVLGRFDGDQAKEIGEVCDRAGKAVESFVLQGLSKTMNDFN